MTHRHEALIRPGRSAAAAGALSADALLLLLVLPMTSHIFFKT
jgi:hypothetical protein